LQLFLSFFFYYFLYSTDRITRVTVFFWKRLFLETAFFGKAHFLDPKKAVFQKKPFSKKSRFPKKAVSKKNRFQKKTVTRITHTQGFCFERLDVKYCAPSSCSQKLQVAICLLRAVSPSTNSAHSAGSKYAAMQIITDSAWFLRIQDFHFISFGILVNHF